MNYYALMVALILISALLMHGNQPKSLKYVIVASMLLYVIYGLRNTYVIGVDSTSSYKGVFERMSVYSWSKVVDEYSKNTAFYLMTKAFSTYISNDYQLYISCIAAFVTICFGRMIYRYSPSPLQSILYHFGLLFYLFHFSALKQSIAMAILMLAFDPLVERKPVKFILLVLIAGQFHFPSIVFLPAYWLTKIQWGKTYLFMLGIALILTYLFRNQLLNLMNSMYSEEAENVDLSGVQFLRTKALIMIVIIVAAVCFRLPSAEDHVYGILLQFIGFSVIIQTFCGYDNTFERLADYYFQFSVVFLPMVFDRRVERKALFSWRFMEVVETVSPFLFCGFAIYRFLHIALNSPFYSPFRFFFQS